MRPKCCNVICWIGKDFLFAGPTLATSDRNEDGFKAKGCGNLAKALINQGA